MPELDRIFEAELTLIDPDDSTVPPATIHAYILAINNQGIYGQTDAYAFWHTWNEIQSIERLSPVSVL